MVFFDIKPFIYCLVLADVGSILAGALELAWTKNKERLTRLAEKLHIVSKK